MKYIPLKIVYTVLIFIIISAPVRFDFFYIQKYINANFLNQQGGYLDILEDTVWDNETDVSGFEEIYIGNGATLIIEAGTELTIPNIFVESGKIVAHGNIDEMIVLKSKEVNLEEIAQEYQIDNIEDYDRNCFFNGSSIEFEVDLSEYVEPSIFEFVKFENMGNYSDDEMYCPWSGSAISKNTTLLNTVTATGIGNQNNGAIKVYSGKVEMKNVIFENNNYSDIEVKIEIEESSQDSYVKIKNSNFQNNKQNTAVISSVYSYNYNAEYECYNDCRDNCSDYLCGLACEEQCRIQNNNFFVPDDKKVVLENNWYGNKLGPTGEFNSIENELFEVVVGEEVSGDLTLEKFDWRGSPDFASNVLFLPGVKASKLYDGNNKVWPPTLFGNDYENLLLNENGNSINDIYTSGALKEVVGINIYKSFIGDLDKMKDDRTIKDYTSFAYDWRKSVDDIVQNGTEYENGVIKNPINEVLQLASSSTSGKVTIVAHSNGGLLAKAIMQELEKQGKENLIDNIVMVSSPQIGAPKAILTMLYGYDEQLVLPWFITNSQAREVAENMPSIYGLLPDNEYFNRTQQPIISFNSSSILKESYGDKINNYDEFKDFLLAKKDKRQKPNKNDTSKANVLNEYLFDKNTQLQEKLNNWIPPENVNLIQIGGWGLDTIHQIDYRDITKQECEVKVDTYGIKRTNCKEVTTESYIPIYTIDGDKVVTTPSSLMMENVDNVERYWLDLFDVGIWIKKNREHKDILETKQLRDLISNIIKKHNTQNELPKYITKYRPNDADTIENSKKDSTRIRMSLYSPLDIHLYDNQGNHTGPIINKKGQKEIEINIPNTYYDTIGEHKYVGWGIDSDVKVKLQGYDKGSYTIELTQITPTAIGEKTDSYLTFKNLPTSQNTKVSFAVPSTGLGDITNLTADYDGDGTVDYELQPKINSETTLQDTQNNTNSIEIKDSQSDDKDDDEDENSDDIKEVSNPNVIARQSEVIHNQSQETTNEQKDYTQDNKKPNNNQTDEKIQNTNSKTIKNIIIILTIIFLIVISVFIFKKLIR
jgi:hypothetical protein